MAVQVIGARTHVRAGAAGVRRGSVCTGAGENRLHAAETLGVCKCRRELQQSARAGADWRGARPHFPCQRTS